MTQFVFVFLNWDRVPRFRINIVPFNSVVNSYEIFSLSLVGFSLLPASFVVVYRYFFSVFEMREEKPCSSAKDSSNVL